MPPSQPPGVRIRAERATDPAERAAIGRLHDAAFGDPQVAPLVEAIRASPGYRPELSLVAELDADPAGPILGHIMLSGSDLVGDNGTTVPILILSPLGVRPGDQNRGIGVALTRAALDLADARPEPLVTVQGHPDYYPASGSSAAGRSGFSRRIISARSTRPGWFVAAPAPRPTSAAGSVYPQPFIDLDE